jgi:hypothetical protein
MVWRNATMAWGRGAWWKQLSDHLHHGTDSRLRRLQIRTNGAGVTIEATAPSPAIRDRAEQAAREVVPDNLLSLRIRVEGDGGGGRAPTAGAADRRARPACAGDLCVGLLVYRRMRELVEGNGPPRPTSPAGVGGDGRCRSLRPPRRRAYGA